MPWPLWSDVQVSQLGKRIWVPKLQPRALQSHPSHWPSVTDGSSGTALLLPLPISILSVQEETVGHSGMRDWSLRVDPGLMTTEPPAPELYPVPVSSLASLPPHAKWAELGSLVGTAEEAVSSHAPLCCGHVRARLSGHRRAPRQMSSAFLVNQLCFLTTGFPAFWHVPFLLHSSSHCLPWGLWRAACLIVPSQGGGCVCRSQASANHLWVFPCEERGQAVSRVQGHASGALMVDNREWALSV